jgi:hypothetical protein
MLFVAAATWWLVSGVWAQPPQSQDTGGSSRPMTPAELLQRRSEKVEEFLRQLDTNGNGMVDADEVSGSQKLLLERMVSPSGGEVKYPLGINQVREDYMKSYRALLTQANSRGAGGAGTAAKAATPPPAAAGAVPAVSPSGGPASGGAATASVSGPAPALGTKSPSTSLRKPVRFLRPHERLPKGLPDWFKAKDTNGDGQISMAEFAAEWTPATEAEFLRYDLNHDGLITPDECLKVEKNSGRRP